MPINSLASFTPPTIPNQDEAEAAAQPANDPKSSSSECSAAPSGAQAAASGAPIVPVDKAGADGGGKQGGAQEHGGGADGGNPFKSLQRIPGFEKAVLTTQIARATQTFAQAKAQTPGQGQSTAHTARSTPAHDPHQPAPLFAFLKGTEAQSAQTPARGSGHSGKSTGSAQMPPDKNKVNDRGSSHARSQQDSQEQGSAAHTAHAAPTHGAQNEPTRAISLPDDARAAAGQLQSLDGAQANQAIDQLQRQGKLDSLAAQMVKPDGWLGKGGLSKDEQGRFLASMAGKLDGAHLALLQHAFAQAGGEHAGDVARAVAAHAPAQTKLQFVRAMAAGASDKAQSSYSLGSSTQTYFNTDAQAAAIVLSSLRGADAQQGFAALSGSQRQAVFNAAAGLSSVQPYSDSGAATSIGNVQAQPFNALLTAARSIADPAARAQVMGQAADAVRAMSEHATPAELAPIANATLRALDADTLSRLNPQQIAGLAASAAQGGNKEDLAATVTALAAQPPTPARDATIRLLFLKTGANAYQGHPQLASAMGQALARTQTRDPAQASALGQQYAAMLGTQPGRALLCDSRVDPGARLWAATQVAANPQRMQALIAGQDKPWESAGVLQLYASANTDRYAAARGNSATVLQGGSDAYNLVGASLGAPITARLSDNAQAASSQAAAARGLFNYYAGNEAVQKAGDGIYKAQHDMGGGDIKVSVLPVQFSSQSTGPVSLQLYKVEGQNGQSRYVDNTGRVYKNFEDWKSSNQLPPGKMTYPAGGQLGAPGATRLETADTPTSNDTWKHVADGAALVGGIVASGVILVGSGGLATPLVVGAWGVAGASAVWTGARAAGTLMDRSAHDQTLSVTDPDARAAWLSLAGSVLTVGGMGAGTAASAASRLASGEAGVASRVAQTAAKTAGTLNTSANYADTAATVNQAADLGMNWNNMTPTERAQAGLQLVFWGGMRGIAARNAGQGLDGLSLRQQMRQAELNSGAANRLNPNLGADASVVLTRNARGAITGISVEYGPNASQAVIDIHSATARDMVKAAGPDGALTRAMTGKGFKPGSYGVLRKIIHTLLQTNLAVDTGH